jgi:hypothetical protein
LARLPLHSRVLYFVCVIPDVSQELSGSVDFCQELSGFVAHMQARVCAPASGCVPVWLLTAPASILSACTPPARRMVCMSLVLLGFAEGASPDSPELCNQRSLQTATAAHTSTAARQRACCLTIATPSPPTDGVTGLSMPVMIMFPLVAAATPAAVKAPLRSTFYVLRDMFYVSLGFSWFAISPVLYIRRSFLCADVFTHAQTMV